MSLRAISYEPSCISAVKICAFLELEKNFLVFARALFNPIRAFIQYLYPVNRPLVPKNPTN
jgi:hypothetical protein